MSLLAEAAAARWSRSPLAAAVVVTFAIVGSHALSACTSLGAAHEAVPVAAASAPEAIVTPPPSPVAPAPSVLAAQPADPATPADLVSRQMLAYHDQLRVLPSNDLAQEINRLAALPVAPETSLQLAMALMQSRNGGELNRAFGLVEPIAKGGPAEQRPWQPFARLMLSRLLDLRRLEDLLDKRNQELRDSQRDVKQLNEKLEALKAIERSLAPRPSSSVSPAGVPSAASVVPASQATASPRRLP